MHALLQPFSKLALDRLPRTVDFPSLQRAMLDQIETGIAPPPPPHETLHFIVPGFYVRQWRGGRGTLVFTMVHQQRHTFQVTQGKAAVWTPEGEMQIIEAGHVGITEPGTQRLLLVLEDLIWTTFHANPDGESDVDVLESRLFAEPLEALLA